MTDDLARMWPRIEPILDVALDLPELQRTRRVEAACAGDEALLRAVRELLRSDAQALGFLELSPTALLTSDDSEPEGSPASGPDRIGPFRIVSELGHGGMGRVLLGERDDGDFEQRVAIKLLHRDIAVGEDRDALVRERRILGQLNHPEIARIYDGGVTADDEPYFVMELVNGAPIDAYCDEHRLGVRERIERFRGVCRAVEYAHGRLVVHCDLKPRNILVTPSGEVKLVDFGIARRLGESVRGAPHALTPAYAAPEQRRGEPVTAATDIYQLGLVLFELLTGRRPRAETPSTGSTIERPSLALLESQVDAEEIAARRGTKPSKLSHRLAGDLDAIVLKSLHDDPAQRYASVEALRRDLEDYLHDLPVAAHPSSPGYRFRKYAWRHRLGVAAAAAVVVSLVGGLIGVAAQARIAAAERDRATRVLAYLKQVFEVSDPSASRGEEITARELLDKSAARMAKDLVREPELAAEMATTMGEVYQGLGLYERAQPLLADALQTRRRVLGDMHPDTLESIAAMGMLLWYQAKPAEAESYVREALESRRRVLGKEHPDTLKSMNSLGLVLSDQGMLAEAEAHLREAMEGCRHVLGPDHPDTLHAINDLGALLWSRGKLAEAERYWREALEGRHRVLGTDHPETQTSRHNLGVLLQAQGKLAEAEGYVREALEGQRRVLGTDHPQTLSTINVMGLLLGSQGKLAEADGFYREALEGRRRVLGNDHPSTLNSINNMGALLQVQGKHAEAELYFREALGGYRRVRGEDHPNTLYSIHNLGFVLQSQGRLVEAEQHLREALVRRRRVLGDDHQDTAKTLSGLASLLNGRGRFDEAEPLAREGLEVLAKRLPAGHWHIARSKCILAAALAGLGRHTEAEPLLVEAEKVLAESTEATAGTKREPVEHLVALYAAWGRPADEARWREKLAAMP